MRNSDGELRPNVAHLKSLPSSQNRPPRHRGGLLEMLPEARRRGLFRLGRLTGRRLLFRSQRMHGDRGGADRAGGRRLDALDHLGGDRLLGSRLRRAAPAGLGLSSACRLGGSLGRLRRFGCSRLGRLGDGRSGGLGSRRLGRFAGGRLRRSRPGGTGFLAAAASWRQTSPRSKLRSWPPASWRELACRRSLPEPTSWSPQAWLRRPSSASSWLRPWAAQQPPSLLPYSPYLHCLT